MRVVGVVIHPHHNKTYIGNLIRLLDWPSVQWMMLKQHMPVYLTNQTFLIIVVPIQTLLPRPNAIVTWWTTHHNKRAVKIQPLPIVVEVLPPIQSGNERTILLRAVSRSKLWSQLYVIGIIKPSNHYEYAVITMTRRTIVVAVYQLQLRMLLLFRIIRCINHNHSVWNSYLRYGTTKTIQINITHISTQMVGTTVTTRTTTSG